MKKVVFLLSVFALISVFANAQKNPGINSEWVNVMEGEGNSNFARVITDGEAVYSAGNYVGSGQKWNNAELPSMGTGIMTLLSKMDNDGNILWSLSFLGTNINTITDLAVAKDGNIMVLGWTASDILYVGDNQYPNQSSFTSNAFIAKIDKETGSVIWFKSTESEDYRSVWSGYLCIGNDGSMYFTGAYDGNFTYGDQSLESTDYVYEDGFVAKLDPDGNPIWMKGFNGPKPQSARTIGVASDNSVFFCLDYEAPIELGGEMLPFEGTEIYWTSIIKLDPNGEFVKFVACGNSNETTTSKGVVVNAEDKVFFSVLFSGSIDVEGVNIQAIGEQNTALVKFDSNLNYVKDVVLGTTSYDQAFGLECHNGLVYLSVKCPTMFDFICDATTKQKINKVSPGCGGYAIVSYDGDLNYINGGYFNSQNRDESTINAPIRFGVSNSSLYLGSDYSGDNELILGKVFTTEPEHGNAYVLRFDMDNFVGVDNVVANDNVKLYPNPVSSQLYIKTDSNVLNCMVYSADGKIIDLPLVGESIEVSSLKSGVYFINIVTKDNTVTKSFIKQ